MNQSVMTRSSAPADTSSVALADQVRDRAEIQGVWLRSFGESPRRYENYLTNPYGAASIWVYRPEGHSIHGAFGLHAQQLSLGGQVHSVGQIGNLAVDTAYRSAGPALRLQRTLLGSLADSDRTLILGVTEEAIPLLRRAGCKSVGTVDRWVKIIKSETQLRKRLRPAWLAKVAAPMVDVGLRLKSRETFSTGSADVTVGFGHTFDSRFDRLWERVSSRFPIATQRTSEYLTWRFYGGEESSFKTFYMADEKGELMGYIVFEVLQNANIEVADVMFDGTPALDRLLSGFLRQMRSPKYRATAITACCFGAKLLGERLQTFGFNRRPDKSQVFVYGDSATLNDADPQLFDTQRWYLTGADGDV
jgi:hypothetical protein